MALSSLLDQLLARCANPETPPGLENRILGRLEHAKAHSGKRLHVACLLVAAGLCAAALVRPVATSAPDATPAKTSPLPMGEGGERSERVRETALENRSPNPALWTRPQRERVRASLIEEFEIQPLKLTSLELSDLSN